MRERVFFSIIIGNAERTNEIDYGLYCKALWCYKVGNNHSVHCERVSRSWRANEIVHIPKKETTTTAAAAPEQAAVSAVADVKTMCGDTVST